METITAIASVNKVQTLADGGIRWTFDLPETAVMQSAMLMAMRQAGAAVQLEIKQTEHVKKHKQRANY